VDFNEINIERQLMDEAMETEEEFNKQLHNVEGPS